MTLNLAPSLVSIIHDCIPPKERDSFRILEIGAYGDPDYNTKFSSAKFSIKKLGYPIANILVSDMFDESEVSDSLVVCDCDDPECKHRESKMEYLKLDLFEENVVKNLEDRKFDLIYVSNVLHCSGVGSFTDCSFMYQNPTCMANIESLKGNLNEGGYLYIRGNHQHIEVAQIWIKQCLRNWDIVDYKHHNDSCYYYLCKPKQI